MADQPTLREHLLNAGAEFVERLKPVPSVRRIALIGSLTTDKDNPKDIDFLVTVDPSADIPRVAAWGRRLKGQAQQRSAGADVFLCSEDDRYLGRLCGYRTCQPRAACLGGECHLGTHLKTDFAVVQLSRELVHNPPIILWPRIEARMPPPEDVQRCLLQ